MTSEAEYNLLVSMWSSPLWLALGVATYAEELLA